MKTWMRDKRVRRYLDTVKRRMVVVHLIDGTSIEGVLVDVYEDCLVLESAAYLSDGRIKIDGRALIERPKVKWTQELTQPAEGA